MHHYCERQLDKAVLEHFKPRTKPSPIKIGRSNSPSADRVSSVMSNLANQSPILGGPAPPVSGQPQYRHERAKTWSFMDILRPKSALPSAQPTTGNRFLFGRSEKTEEQVPKKEKKSKKEKETKKSKSKKQAKKEEEEEEDLSELSDAHSVSSEWTASESEASPKTKKRSLSFFKNRTKSEGSPRRVELPSPMKWFNNISPPRMPTTNFVSRFQNVFNRNSTAKPDAKKEKGASLTYRRPSKKNKKESSEESEEEESESEEEESEEESEWESSEEEERPKKGQRPSITKVQHIKKKQSESEEEESESESEEEEEAPKKRGSTASKPTITKVQKIKQQSESEQESEEESISEIHSISDVSESEEEPPKRASTSSRHSVGAQRPSLTKVQQGKQKSHTPSESEEENSEEESEESIQEVQGWSDEEEEDSKPIVKKTVTTTNVRIERDSSNSNDASIITEKSEISSIHENGEHSEIEEYEEKKTNRAGKTVSFNKRTSVSYVKDDDDSQSNVSDLSGILDDILSDSAPSKNASTISSSHNSRKFSDLI